MLFGKPAAIRFLPLGRLLRDTDCNLLRQSFQLAVFRFGSAERWYVTIGLFPEREEILIGSIWPSSVSRQGTGAADYLAVLHSGLDGFGNDIPAADSVDEQPRLRRLGARNTPLSCDSALFPQTPSRHKRRFTLGKSLWDLRTGIRSHSCSALSLLYLSRITDDRTSALAPTALCRRAGEFGGSGTAVIVGKPS